MRGEFLDLSGASLYYYAAGTRGSGEPIVCLHGFPTSGHVWSAVVPLLPPGHRIVVLDLLGYGRSDRPIGRGVGIGAHAARVAELLDELHIERACIVGHGTGGGIAQVLALRHPSRVSRLCLVNSVAFGNGGVRERIARVVRPLAPHVSPRTLGTLLRRFVQRGYTDPARAARSVDLYLRPFAGADGREALLEHIRALRDDALPSAADLGRIQTPTTIVRGAHDRADASCADLKLSRDIPGASLVVAPDARRFAPEESPRPVADAIAALLAR
jgi:pimeloyl-ACP methyl ester carboxylesterase